MFPEVTIISVTEISVKDVTILSVRCFDSGLQFWFRFTKFYQFYCLCVWWLLGWLLFVLSIVVAAIGGV